MPGIRRHGTQIEERCARAAVSALHRQSPKLLTRHQATEVVQELSRAELQVAPASLQQAPGQVAQGEGTLQTIDLVLHVTHNLLRKEGVGHIAGLEARRGRREVEYDGAAALLAMHAHSRRQSRLNDVGFAPLGLDGLV